jgi:cytosine deaminase
MSDSPRLLLQGGLDGAGRRLDVLCDPATGLIAATGAALAAAPGDEVLDCTGMVLLTAPAEPHAHLDKALSAEAAPNPAGDLAGAIDAWHAHWPDLTEADILDRARRAALELVAHGTTAIRSHADVSPVIGTTAIRALATLREELREQGLAELQVVALVSPPGPDEPDAAGYRDAQLRSALAAGADVAGGCPHLDPDPIAATRAAFGIAEELGCPIDLHTDETLNVAMLALPELIALVADGGFTHGAVASHCVSLGVQPLLVQERVARAAAAAPVAIVTLPQTNLFLQAREHRTSPPRGLTAVRALLDAGACLAAGADNVRDPFNAMGRCDALETAALLVMAAHLTPREAWTAVSVASRRAMGLPELALEAGAPAEVLAVRGLSLGDAIARASEHRHVVHRGRCVARTAVTSTLMPRFQTPLLV